MSVVNEVVALCPTVPVARRRRTLPPAVTFVGASVAFVGVTFAAGAPSPLLAVFQQEWGFPAWVLTIAFAIYAVTLLVTLLIAGSLSDTIGRRPVLIGALVVQLASMLIFVFARDITWIIVARAIQGVATGAATSTFSATIVELAPERRKKLGALIGSVAPVGGLALGAIVTGVAVQFTAYPSELIFGFLALIFVLGTLVVIASPETVSRRPGALRSLIPRLSVPVAARAPFVASVPILIATWMVAGLFLGLAPSILRGLFGIDSGLVAGLLVGLQPAAGTVAAILVSRLAPRTAITWGTMAVILGVGVFAIGVLAGVLPLLFVGAVLAGAGFGSAFSSTLRSVGTLAEPHQRAELFAALFLVSYLAYGVPALIAGELIGVIGLETTVLGYAAVAMIAAVAGLIARALSVRIGMSRERSASRG